MIVTGRHDIQKKGVLADIIGPLTLLYEKIIVSIASNVQRIASIVIDVITS